MEVSLLLCIYFVFLPVLLLLCSNHLGWARGLSPGGVGVRGGHLRPLHGARPLPRRRRHLMAENGRRGEFMKDSQHLHENIVLHTRVVHERNDWLDMVKCEHGTD